MLKHHPPNRWLIALAGTGLQLCLGTVYAWSYFQEPLVKTYGWTNMQVTWTFSLVICCLGLAAAWGGINLPRFGPRKLAVTGGALFGAGYLLAALALHLESLPLLYIGYGVVGGCGLGLGYVTPVATVAKWFPDKKGLSTGMVIMGFGFGALLMSKVFAPWLDHLCGGNLVLVFAWLGAGFAFATVLAASVLRNPPENYFPQPKPQTPGSKFQQTAAIARPVPLAALFNSQFFLMWAIFFCNILAGISLISFQSPLVQELWRETDSQLSPEALAAYGATLIAVSSLFNGVGRMLWGGLSDRIGRLTAFRLMLATQVAAFAALIQISNPWVFGGLVCYVLLCYGGGFGTMPSFVLDAFGSHRMAMYYGAVLTAWSAAGIVGPQWVAFLKDHHAEHLRNYAFLVDAGMLGAGLGLTMFLRKEEKPA